MTFKLYNIARFFEKQSALTMLLQTVLLSFCMLADMHLVQFNKNLFFHRNSNLNHRSSKLKSSEKILTTKPILEIALIAVLR